MAKTLAHGGCVCQNVPQEASREMDGGLQPDSMSVTQKHNGRQWHASLSIQSKLKNCQSNNAPMVGAGLIVIFIGLASLQA